MKVILLGDSITQGLGSKKINFEKELEKLVPDCSIVNLAMAGTVIEYVSSVFRDIEKESADFAVILYGNVDAMRKPSRTGKVFPKLPRRFTMNNGSMLLPRPFYSHVWYKKLGQHIENGIRTGLRKLVFAVDGTEQWMPLDLYIKHYEDVCAGIRAIGTHPVICSTVYIDERLFPGSNAEYIRYNTWMENYANENQIRYIDFYGIFKRLAEKNGWSRYYNCDHFHPNDEGYLVMAKNIAEAIRVKG